ncbi:MAG: hypothetical protein ACI84K_000751 [Pseudohongiellaceae bacterium]|jgi:hypothetical protein
MPKQQIKHLISDLHEKFGDDLTSPQQQALMLQLESHIHDLSESGPVEPGLLETVDSFITLIEDDHPNAAVIVNKILETLRNIGV